MLNFTPDTEDAFTLYKKAVSRKTDDAEKKELQGIEINIKSLYNVYKASYDTNTVDLLQSDLEAARHKDALLNLYSSKCALVKHFRERFFKRNPQTYNNVCPYCTIGEASTTEHILPKENYPEYAVDVLNLIPACSGCNSLKGEDLHNKAGERFFINYYTDSLPNVQYLFVSFTVTGDAIKGSYYLDNSSGQVDKDLFALIQRHYSKFNLVGKDSRFDSKAIQLISEIKNMYLNEEFESGKEYDAFAAKQLRKCDMDSKSYGINHWRVVLYRSAAESSVFKDYVKGHSDKWV